VFLILPLLISSTMKTQVLALIALASQCSVASAERRLRQLHSAQVLHVDEKPPVSLVSINRAEDHLLHFLEMQRSLENGTVNLPPYADFMPACLEHTKDLVQSLDQGYTDMQLQQNLELECHRDKEFKTAEDGFDGHKACLKFASELTAARKKELKSGSLRGYRQFCEKFFVHKGGEKPKKEKKEKKEKTEKQEKKEKKEKQEEKKERAKKVEDKEEEEKEQAALSVDAVEKEVTEPAFAPAAAPVASPMASPVASPMASPAASPAPGPAFAPAPVASIEDVEPGEFKSKCDLVYDAEYKRQMNMGRSNERAKKEAKAARYKCMGINQKGPKSVKGDTQWWAIDTVVGLVLAFIIAGVIVHYRNS